MSSEITGLLDKAKQSAEAAQSLLADNYVDFAASRAYYAMFYALEALLLTKSLSYSKHSAVISAFGKEYIKSGIFDSCFHRAVIDAFDLRNAGDYGTMHAVSEELATQTIQNARELIQAVSTHIKDIQRLKGFTLVELAVSLVVIGLLIGLGMSMVGPLMTGIKVRESKENLGAAVESINSWASGNNRLPDAASGTTDFKSVVRTPADAWGRDFIYLYDQNLMTSATKDTICGRRSTTISLTDSNTSATIQNIAYILFSYGDDAVSNTTLISGTLTPSPTTPPKIEASSYVSAGNAAAISANTTDDLVRWVTLDELRTKVGCQGAQMKIVTNELPFGYNNASYNANIYADGGVPFSTGGKFAWCIQTSLGDITAPTSLTFKSTGGTNIPLKANCSSGVAVQSDYLVIGGTPVIIVKGSDGNNYASIQTHVSALTSQPITGATYTQYWQLTTSSITAPAWAASTYYPAASNNATVYAYDSSTNSAYKSFVFTINPQ